MHQGYRIYYYDSWSETYEGYGTYDTLADAKKAAEKDLINTADTDITAVFISWFEDGIEQEIQYNLDRQHDEWERV